ncbi:hypothetical protein [Endozoicomonas sp. SCSIO W0465]|nr:hypothetical protein [Endozoicomonas sp. SCSIO W0465]
MQWAMGNGQWAMAKVARLSIGSGEIDGSNSAIAGEAENSQYL